MVRTVRAAVVPLVLAGLIVLSGVVLGRIYAGPLLAQLVAGAAVGSVAVGVATRRLPSWTVAPISVLLLAGYTVLAVRLAANRAGLTDPLPDLVTDALANGIPRMLTAMIPVEATPDTVVVPVIAAWLAGLAGTEITVRGGRVLLGCLPATALYAGALYVVGPNAAAAGWPSSVFAGLVAVGLVTAKPFIRTGLRGLPAGAREVARWRGLVAATAGLIVVVALIGLVGPWVGGRVSAEPVDPRKYVSPPQVDSLDESPLNRISGWALTPAERLLTVRTSGREMRLRLAVLSDYDGITWRVGATYRNAGRVLPPQPVPPDAAVDEVRQDITVDGLSGRLLPVVPTPTEVQGARVAYDPATGTLIRPEQLNRGLRYTATSQRQTPDLNLLPGAESPTGDAVARFLAVGAEVPDALQRLADQLAEGNGAAFDRALAIEEFLAEHYRTVPDAPSGHAYPNLSFFLFGPRGQGGQEGTSEQFAAAYAVLARLTGLPSRVVVGFDTPDGGGPVTAGDALAWPEVLFDDLGWVAFDPMPKSKNPPRPVEEDFTPKPTTPPPTPSEPPPDDPSASAPPPLLAAAPSGGIPAALVTGGVSGSALLLIAAAALAVVLLRRAQRRRRLTEGPPHARISGAWLEFTDALRLAGRPVPRHLAATEAAAFALRKAAPGDVEQLPPLDDLVAGVNTASFAPGAVDEGQAGRAGAQAVTYADALRRHRPWWRRAWWSVHPGPLRWHRPHPDRPGPG
jgi:transglutaminase-like putative cysteine protease